MISLVSNRESHVFLVNINRRVYEIDEWNPYLSPLDCVWLYERMRINVKLSEELGIHIYSFPMKYIPLYGEEAKDRKSIEKFWNKKILQLLKHYQISRADIRKSDPEHTALKEKFDKIIKSDRFVELTLTYDFE